MEVKEAVLLAATELGIVDEVQSYLDNASTEGQKNTELLLTCFNLVENELALDYLPLYAEDELTSLTGKISYSALRHSAVRVLKVTDEWGNNARFTLFPDCFKTQPGKLKITYTYTPEKKDIEGESDFTTVSARLFSYGIAAEYATAMGLYEEAAVWDKKYKEAIDAAYRISPCVRIQSRRWV